MQTAIAAPPKLSQTQMILRELVEVRSAAMTTNGLRWTPDQLRDYQRRNASCTPAPSPECSRGLGQSSPWDGWRGIF